VSRKFTATFLLLCLATVSGQAQSNVFESEDMAELARPRPGARRVYRCCSVSRTGEWYCRESTEKLLAWSRAFTACENRNGKESCITACRSRTR